MPQLRASSGMGIVAGAPTRSDVVVVGGGITGSFAAYFLARGGVDVALVERGGVASQASGANPGGLNPLHGAAIPGPMETLARESFRLHLESWDALDAHADAPFNARRVTRIQLAREKEDLAHLEQTRAMHEAVDGFSAEWLEPAELLALEPRLNAGMIGGLLTRGSAAVDAGPYTRAVAAAAAAHGAHIVADRAIGVAATGERLSEVMLENGRIRCDAAIIATGAVAGEASRWLRVDLPIEPVRGELLLAELPGAGLAHDVTWRAAALYARHDHAVWLGGTEDRAGFDAGPTEVGRASILERVAGIFPEVAHARVVGHIAGLRPVTPDELPIIGLAPGWDNVCLAMGAGRKGMLLGAAMGRAAADIVTAGATAVPIGACGPDRFAAGVRAFRPDRSAS